MQGFREIEARAGAARAPCAAYWLMVFVYLMIQLFPVADFDKGVGYQNRGSAVIAAAADDWAPPPGIEETPVLPRAEGAAPRNFVIVVTPKAPRSLTFFDPTFFDSRGPPMA